MTEIAGSVGEKGANARADVAWVQTALIRHAAWLTLAQPLAVTGVIDPATIAAIRQFQTGPAALAHADGVVSPRGFTVTQLARAFIARPASKVFAPVCWNRGGGGLVAADYAAAAASLGCQPAAIQAVAQTETKRSAWDAMGRPTILYERHYFSRLSGRRFDRTHADISNRRAYRRAGAGVSADNSYGKGSAQYPRLFRAATLDEAAALQSASWGAFQIMGANYAACGFSSIDDFVDAMMASEKRQLDALVAFVNSNAGMKTALQTLDWTAFAKRYNGTDDGTLTGNVVDNYDGRLAAAYAALQPRPGAPGTAGVQPAHP